MCWVPKIFDWANQDAQHPDFSFEMRNVSLTPPKAGAYARIGIRLLVARAVPPPSSRMKTRLLAFVGAVVLTWPTCDAAPPQGLRPAQFESGVQAILQTHCTDCHGEKTKARELDLRSLDSALKGSDSGPVIIPNKPEESKLYTLVRDGKMPVGKPRLSAQEVTTLSRWIESLPPSADGPRFETTVQPILQAKCTGCHGTKLRTKELNLTTHAGVIKGSESGLVVVPGKPDDSKLYQYVKAGVMPRGGPRLSDQDVALIRTWIEAGALSASVAGEQAPVAQVTQHDVIPVLYLRCTVCHGKRKQEGGLDLRSTATIRRGGKSGPAIVPGKPQDSLLIRKIESGEMPPAKLMLEVSVRPISKAETDLIAQWIAEGAPEVPDQPDVLGAAPDPLVTDKDRQFWAFQPPRAVSAPDVKGASRVRNPIDAFVLRKLEGKGLTLSPEADRLTLIRRAYFDLIGLPPKPQDVQTFLADKDPTAYEKLIDRLLASPHYGERWARFWLDAAGYSDSEGKQNQDAIRPTAFRYRDYVIRSLNADKPYNRFLLEQIAGDELADYENAPVITQELMDNLIATGFLRMAADATNQRDENFVDDRREVIDDEIEILSSAVMGLTLKCARCHSHKYEPIPQRDYYRFCAIFKGAYDEHDWIAPYRDKRTVGRYLPYVTPGASPVQLLLEQQNRDARNLEIQQEIDSLQNTLKEKEGEFRNKVLQERIKSAPEGVRSDLQELLKTPPDKLTGTQKELTQKYEKLMKLDELELRQVSPGFRALSEETQLKEKLLDAARPADPTIRALSDSGDPSPTYLLRRGSTSSFGRLVGPGVPSVLTDGKTPFAYQPPWPGANKTGLRLALAQWLVRPDHPLTARVMVNRIWQHHFDAGIVKSVGNFGRSGTPPTDPELLDWLAREFVNLGWSMKTMHRMIMTSTTYRQSSAVTPRAAELDPENALLSRMPLRRMEAEELFDTLASVAGRLDETPFGFPAPVLVRDDGSATPIPTEQGWRRGIYTMQRRKEMPTMLADFDLPQMSPNCLERSESTVAPQALYLLNDDLVRKLADSFAQRVVREVGAEPARQIERMYWIALGRPPKDDERQVTLEDLQKLRDAFAASSSGAEAQQRALARVGLSLINTGAFIYID
jgi:mono/diheme cytochrome c family protein